MDKKSIGPSFHGELLAKGLLGHPFSWTGEGEFNFADSCPADVVAGVKSAYDAHDPTGKCAIAVRSERDAALAATDWLAVRHMDEQMEMQATTLSPDQVKALGAYRKALRDLPAAKGFPNVALPVAPDFIGVK